MPKPEEIIDACIFEIEHVLNYMFVPGKLENMTTVIDLGKIGILETPKAVRHQLPTFLAAESISGLFTAEL